MTSVTSPVMELDNRPATRRAVIADLVGHRNVLWALARTDFQVRYKRAVLGVLWVVVLPVMQAAILATILSRVIKFGGGHDFAAYVVSGVLPWAYFAGVLEKASTSIVDGAGMADKIWFPRALLPIVHCMAALVGLGISLCIVVVAMPVLGVTLDAKILLLVPAALLLVLFTTGLSLVMAALHVHYHDVRHLVSASVLLWFYATPIFYPASLLKGYRGLLDFNPMTGVITLFHMATVGAGGPWHRSVTVSVFTTVALLVAAVEIYRRQDRLLVDKL